MRSPVMVPAEDVVPWLDPGIKGTDALSQFAAAAYGRCLTGWQVGDGAKQVSRDDATFIEPVAAADH